ncbi:MAG: hypothetical protein QOJ47_1161, partial [Gaiellales bacterium]|nr:hypothetical protein [Gaiellales bacterium]
MADADQLRRDGEAMLSPRAVLALAALALAFGVVIVGGYTYDWRFTGFPGKTLWDWLDLLVLPFSLSLLPISLESS